MALVPIGDTRPGRFNLTIIERRIGTLKIRVPTTERVKLVVAFNGV
jgi:hypothetical protein